MPKAARIGDICAGHGCFPPTPIIAGSGDVSINGIPAARKGDAVLLHACPCPYMVHGIHPRSISKGSSTVTINGKPASRVGDAIGCGGSISAGSGNVFIGDKSYRSSEHKCAEAAAAAQQPFMSIKPVVDGLPATWAESSGLGIMDAVHASLDAGGMVPALGIVPDAINGLIYLAEGDFADAAISGAAMVPVIGQAATTAKYGAKAAKVAEEATKVDSKLILAQKMSNKARKLMKKFNPPCFKPGKALRKRFKNTPQKLEKEFYKQLKNQQNGINKMTVGKYLENRKILKDLVKEHGHKKARKILTGGGAAQIKARDKLYRSIFKSVSKSYRKQGKSITETKALAKIKANEKLKELAALHDPDMIAGGADKISRLGNKNVNSSLGSQWAKASRVSEMDKAAKEALNKYGSEAYMNVELTRCK